MKKTFGIFCRAFEAAGTGTIGKQHHHHHREFRRINEDTGFLQIIVGLYLITGQIGTRGRTIAAVTKHRCGVRAAIDIGGLIAVFIGDQTEDRIAFAE